MHINENTTSNNSIILTYRKGSRRGGETKVIIRKVQQIKSYVHPNKR